MLCISKTVAFYELISQKIWKIAWNHLVRKILRCSQIEIFICIVLRDIKNWFFKNIFGVVVFGVYFKSTLIADRLMMMELEVGGVELFNWTPQWLTIPRVWAVFFCEMFKYGCCGSFFFVRVLTISHPKFDSGGQRNSFVISSGRGVVFGLFLNCF